MKWKKTVRGFDRAEFIDRYGQKCSIQKSSLATEDCIWLGVDTNITGEDVGERMHLTQEAARDLWPVLRDFARTGELRWEDENGGNEERRDCENISVSMGRFKKILKVFK